MVNRQVYADKMFFSLGRNNHVCFMEIRRYLQFDGFIIFLMNQLLGQGDPVLSQVRLTWRIIPPSKWLIKPVGKSPFRGLIPSTHSGWLRNPAPVGNYC